MQVYARTMCRLERSRTAQRSGCPCRSCRWGPQPTHRASRTRTPEPVVAKWCGTMVSGRGWRVRARARDVLEQRQHVNKQDVLLKRTQTRGVFELTVGGMVAEWVVSSSKTYGYVPLLPPDRRSLVWGAGTTTTVVVLLIVQCRSNRAGDRCKRWSVSKSDDCVNE